MPDGGCMKKLIGLILLAVLGCATTNVTRMGEVEYPPREIGCKIDVLYEAPKKKKFERVCLISRITSASVFDRKTLEAMLPDLSEEACQCGADAILLTQVEEGTVWGSHATASGRATAFAIKYK